MVALQLRLVLWVGVQVEVKVSVRECDSSETVFEECVIKVRVQVTVAEGVLVAEGFVRDCDCEGESVPVTVCDGRLGVVVRLELQLKVPVMVNVDDRVSLTENVFKLAVTDQLRVPVLLKVLVGSVVALDDWVPEVVNVWDEVTVGEGVILSVREREDVTV